MVVYEKADFEAQKYKEDIWPKINIVQLYLM